MNPATLIVIHIVGILGIFILGYMVGSRDS
jgi:hypothetical protein